MWGRHLHHALEALGDAFGYLWRPLWVVAVTIAASTAFAQEAPPPASPPIARAHPAPLRSANPLEHRVQLLTHELGLDARQQAQVRAILQSQREAVTRIWADPELSPEERGPATRAVEQQTGDRIRDVLTEEQKKKYNPPQPNQAVSAGLSSGASGPDVEKWLEMARARNNASGESP